MFFFKRACIVVLVCTALNTVYRPRKRFRNRTWYIQEVIIRECLQYELSLPLMQIV